MLTAALILLVGSQEVLKFANPEWFPNDVEDVDGGSHEFMGPELERWPSVPLLSPTAR